MRRVRSPAPRESAPILRCAVYTRVSTDNGLDQDFNSLDAQHEACEAYIKSQAHEGWRLVDERFDDGGYSGGSLDRPALAKLLDRIAAGRVDVIVVYKVDRLTRSLADFAKLVELFDARRVSFVSITQSFNTTSSMGRLTLNMLLSFAQFEREVTGERIRDKIAASKKKGIWVGGNPPFGYRVVDRKLVADPEEAAVVTMIFERYVALGSLSDLLAELRQKKIVTRPRQLSSGAIRGGIPFGRGALAALLKNRTYLGELNHRGRSYPGEHAAILDRHLFDRVQALLRKNANSREARRAPSQALLKGLIYDDRGQRMTPGTANKGARGYRYYVSRALAEGARDQAGSLPRVAAQSIEDAVLAKLRECPQRCLAGGRRKSMPGAGGAENDPSPSASGPDGRASDCDPRALVERLALRVVVSMNDISIDLTDTGAELFETRRLSIPWTPRQWRVRRDLLEPANTSPDRMRSDTRASLLLAIARGRAWLNDLVSGHSTNADDIARRESRSRRYVHMMLSLAFLAPDIVQAGLDGALPPGIGVSRLIDLPSDWSRQKTILGLA